MSCVYEARVRILEFSAQSIRSSSRLSGNGRRSQTGDRDEEDETFSSSNQTGELAIAAGSQTSLTTSQPVIGGVTANAVTSQQPLMSYSKALASRQMSNSSPTSISEGLTTLGRTGQTGTKTSLELSLAATGGAGVRGVAEGEMEKEKKDGEREREREGEGEGEREREGEGERGREREREEERERETAEKTVRKKSDSETSLPSPVITVEPSG